MGRFNGKTNQPLAENLDKITVRSENNSKVNDEKEWGVWAAFTGNPVTRTNMIVMSVNWATSHFNYYLVTYLMKYFHGDVYSNFIIGGVADVCSCRLTARIIEKFGVKQALVTGYLIGGSGMIGLILHISGKT